MVEAVQNGPADRAAGRQSRRLSGLSLRTRLLLLVMAGVLPLLGFGLIEIYRDYQGAVAQTGNETLLSARSLSAALDAELQARINTLQVLATSTRLRAGDIDGFRTRAKEVIDKQYPGANLVLLKQEGEQLMNLAAAPGMTLPNRPHTATIERVFATGKPAVSDLYAGAVLKRLVISIDVPVLGEDSKVVAVLSMVPIDGMFDDIIRRHRSRESAITTVFDRQYVILARSPGREQFVGQKAGQRFLAQMSGQAEGVIESISREGIPVFAVFTRSEAFGWTVSLGVPRSALTGPAIESAAREIVFALVLLLCGLLLSSLVARRISGPIQTLHELASAAADNIPSLKVSTGLAETDRVAEALHLTRERQVRSERRFRTLFEANPLAMCVYDLDSLRVLEVNGAMVEMYQWTRDELLGLSLPDIWPPEDQVRLSRNVSERLSGQFSLRQLRKDGSRFDAEAVVKVIELDGRRVGVSICQDVTSRKAVEEQLRQSQKMETLGQIAGGVAHDFNNSLAVVMASVEDILDYAPHDSEIHASAELAMHATEQAAALTRRLLAFSRRQEVTLTELDVANVVYEVWPILRSSVRGSIEVNVQGTAGDLRCLLDRTQLETALMNLVVNARDAINGSGSINVEIGRRTITHSEAAAIPGTRAGNWVVVSVTDNGQGMSDDIRARIFEPFFTTKDVGKGTGLGLSQIHGFIVGSGGFIIVNSTQGIGTRVAMHFAPVQQVP